MRFFKSDLNRNILSSAFQYGSGFRVFARKAEKFDEGHESEEAGYGSSASHQLLSLMWTELRCCTQMLSRPIVRAKHIRRSITAANMRTKFGFEGLQVGQKGSLTGSPCRAQKNTDNTMKADQHDYPRKPSSAKWTICYAFCKVRRALREVGW